jgi:hypothetical protein
MMNEKKVSLKKTKKVFAFDNDYCDPDYFHLLPSNQILIISSFKDTQFNMAVLNKTGDDLIHFKELKKQHDEEDEDEDDMDDEFHVNATNIVRFKRTDSIVEIYNFKLEIVHSFRAEKSDILCLNNYEIALSYHDDNYNKLIIRCYNYKTVKTIKKEIRLNTKEFKRLTEIQLDKGKYLNCYNLVGLNDKFLFISATTYFDDSMISILFILNREDNNNLFKYFSIDSDQWFIYNKEVCQGYDDDDRNWINIWNIDLSKGDDIDAEMEYLAKCSENNIDSVDVDSDSDGISEYTITDKPRKFRDLYATSNYKYIYSKKVKSIKGKLTLKLKEY